MEFNYRALFKGLSQYRQPLNYELVGKTICMKLSDGEEGEMTFLSETKLKLNLFAFSQENAYEVTKIDDHVYVAHFEIEHASPRRCLSLVYDKENGQVVIFLAKQGHCEEYLRKVEREIYFGSVKDETTGLYPEITTGYTSDLVGKAIDFTYTSDHTVRHMYLADHRFRWEFIVAGKEAFGAKQEEYCDYIKVNDHIYIFSWLEKIAGVQGFCVENLDRMYHVGGFFGIGPDDLPECYMMAAYGREYQS